MLIARVQAAVFVFLKNPKCASTSLGHHLAQLAETHAVLWRSIPRQNINDCKGDYSHPHYNHCNLKGAVRVLRALAIDPAPAIVVTTVREPLSKLESVYFHELRGRDFVVHPDRRKDFETLVLKNPHVAQFRPEAFRRYGPYKATHLIRVESFEADLADLSERYGWGLKFEHDVRENMRREKTSLPVSPTLHAKIRELYRQDYEEGGYS